MVRACTPITFGLLLGALAGLPALPSNALAQAALGTAITYQGRLKSGGEPVNGRQSLRFDLYDAAVAGQLIASATASNVDVTDGLFTAAPDFGAGAFNGDARWLEIAVYETGSGWVVLSPRQPILAAPYALYALNGGGGGGCVWSEFGNDIYYHTGRVGIGTTAPQRRLHVVDSATSPTALIRNNGSGDALRLESIGRALVALGDYRGVEAWSDSHGAVALWGSATAETGLGTGVYGSSASSAGRGVWGSSVGANAFGVYGHAAADTGNATGVYGVTESSGGFGVWGVATATTGMAEGGRFTTNAPLGRGVFGSCTATTGTNYGVYGRASSTSGRGVFGEAVATSGTTYGIYGQSRSPTGVAVRGESLANTGANFGVYGSSAGGTGSAGVRGHNESGPGGRFTSTSGYAAIFDGVGGLWIDHSAGAVNTAGVHINTTGTEEPLGLQVNVNAAYGRLADFNLSNAGGYYGNAFTISGDCLGNVLRVHSRSTHAETTSALHVQSDGLACAIYGYNTRQNDDQPAIIGYHVGATDNWGVGVRGVGGFKGVEGTTEGVGNRYGVWGSASGTSGSRWGVYGTACGTGTTKYGVYGTASGTGTNYAGYFSGNAHVTGTLSKGGGAFKIDHPLDPTNKYLYHSFVESPDMMNVYNGNVVLDASGAAVVVLPEWFEALNSDFRYQLTCIGGFAPVYVAEEIDGNQFRIAGGRPGLKVSWQVTGIRQDAFAQANRIPVEVDKPADERGMYLHPEAFGLPAELQLDAVRDAVAEAEKDAARRTN